MRIIDQTASELLPQLESGAISARAVTEAFCDQIAATDAKVGAFLSHDRDGAIAQADAIDQRRKRGEPVGKLAGLPIAIKDVLCVRGQTTTCASRILDGFRPPYDAHVIERLRAADAVFIGRVNMDEFAMGSSCENSGYQPTRNPWDLARVPGGSSGGSAAAVAARQAPLAIGTDTGGSIRQPAGFCGIVGLKPTYGRVSRYGLVAFASSLDQIGPMAQSVRDAALLLEVLAGHDGRDATSVDQAVPSYHQLAEQPIDGLRVGIVDEHFGPGLDPRVEQAVRAALDKLQSRGAKLVKVSLPHARYAIATYYLVATAEASSNLARYDGVHYGIRAENFDDMISMYCNTRGEGFGAEVKRRIILGTFVLSAGYRDAYYIKALKVRRLIKQDYDAAFSEVDVIAGPVTPTPAFKIGEKTDDPLTMYLSDVYTVSANLAGIPGLCLPCGFTDDGLPIGLQLQGPTFSEPTLLRAGRMVEQVVDLGGRKPPL